MPLPTRPIGLYIHIPFCAQKCPYCDFNTYAGLGSLFHDYVSALCLELVRWSRQLTECTVNTVFIGGGTPTVLELSQLAQVFDTVYRHFRLAKGCEITCEANPGTVDQARFAGLHGLGVNRLSLGAQSFRPAELQFLGRIHSVDQVYRAYDMARQAGFDNINLDFMFGLPRQPLSNWQATLEEAIALAPEHLSLYSLTVEPNTPLHHRVQTGQVDAPDDDLAATHYEVAMERLGEAGYIHYEVSNWAKTRDIPHTSRFTFHVSPLQDRTSLEDYTFACQHNLIYWRNQEYLGVGPGAHSHLYTQRTDGERMSRRWGNRRSVPDYIRRVREDGSIVEFEETIDPPLGRGETMMLGLRLLQEGVPFHRFQTLHGVDLRTAFARELVQLRGGGLLVQDEERVRLTRWGLMVGNQVFATFLPDTAEVRNAAPPKFSDGELF